MRSTAPIGERERRSFVFRRVQSLFFVLLATAALLSIAFLLVLAPLAWAIVLKYFPHAETLSGQLVVFRYGVVGLVLITGLYASHLWLPAGERPFAILWPGIILTIIASFAGSTLFASYLEQFATYASTYAGLASGIIALLFLYLLATFVIVGAELNAAISRYRQARASVVPSVSGGRCDAVLTFSGIGCLSSRSLSTKTRCTSRRAGPEKV